MMCRSARGSRLDRGVAVLTLIALVAVLVLALAVIVGMSNKHAAKPPPITQASPPPPTASQPNPRQSAPAEIQIVCYERESVLPILDRNHGEPFSFREGGTEVVVRPSGPEELRWPAEVSSDKVVFKNPTAPEAVYTLDRIAGTLIYSNNGEFVTRSVCASRADKRF